jgi:hypothetical protein
VTIDRRIRMKVNLIRLGRAALLTATLLVAPATSQAALLVPGGIVNPDLLVGPAGTLVASALSPLIAGGDLIANVRSAVVRNAGGTLDFYYQVGNSGLSATSLSLVNNESFATFATDVFFRLGNGGLDIFRDDGKGIPTTVARSADGVNVAFNFFGPLNSFKLNPGEISRILVVRTDATNFAPGLTTITPTFASGASFAPAGAIPEPASLLLLGSAFAAAGYVARHRRKKPTTV